MRIRVGPACSVAGEIQAPASKSYSIRAFFVAALGGRSQILFPSDCDDARVARRCARALGAMIKPCGDGYSVQARRTPRKKLILNVGESGTSLRFLLPILPFFCEQAVVNGEGTLRKRPNRDLILTCRRYGLKITGRGQDHRVPIRFDGGQWKGRRWLIDGSLSSQYISALLLAAALREETTTIEVTGRRPVSTTYVDMTAAVLRRTGVRVEKKDGRRFVVERASRLRGLGRWVIPSDYGLAAFGMGAALLLPSRVVLQGRWDADFPQADSAFLDIVHRMGGRFAASRRRLVVKGPQTLSGGVFSLKDAPDLVPITAVLALFARGRTRLTGIGHVRAKESDRIQDLSEELSKIGARIRAEREALTIFPTPESYRSGVTLNPHHDHRLAMAFAVLGLKCGVTIQDKECTRKSYPDFWKDWRSLLNHRSGSPRLLSKAVKTGKKIDSFFRLG